MAGAKCSLKWQGSITSLGRPRTSTIRVLPLWAWEDLSRIRSPSQRQEFGPRNMPAQWTRRRTWSTLSQTQQQSSLRLSFAGMMSFRTIFEDDRKCCVRLRTILIDHQMRSKYQLKWLIRLIRRRLLEILIQQATSIGPRMIWTSPRTQWFLWIMDRSELLSAKSIRIHHVCSP